MIYTCKHTLYRLTSPLQFPHEPPGVREPHFGKPWFTTLVNMNNKFFFKEFIILANVHFKMY